MQPFDISTSVSSVRDRSAPPLAHEIGVDVDLAHVVDDDRDLEPVAVVQDVIEQRRLAGAEKAGQHRHRQAAIDMCRRSNSGVT